jgi:hypothetical protein
MTPSRDPSSRWLDHLSTEDLAFLRRFVLSSGSLKQVAGEYGISYPTVRLRLDRLIAKIRLVEEATDADSFELTLRSAYADGQLDDRAFRRLLSAYQQQKEEHDA